MGEETEVRLQPAEAYGEHNAELVSKIPREQLQLPEGIEQGMVLAIALPDGRQTPAKVTELTDDEITLDLNHPMAGKILNFKIKVVEIS